MTLSEAAGLPPAFPGSFQERFSFFQLETRQKLMRRRSVATRSPRAPRDPRRGPSGGSPPRALGGRRGSARHPDAVTALRDTATARPRRALHRAQHRTPIKPSIFRGASPTACAAPDGTAAHGCGTASGILRAAIGKTNVFFKWFIPFNKRSFNSTQEAELAESTN